MPRSRAIAPLVLGLLAAAAAARAQEDPPPFRILIEPPARIVLGDRSEIVAQVLPGPGPPQPMLVTPVSEGPAIEIVQGRFTRADADDPDDPILRFEIPFVARSVGTSVIRVRVDGFACADERCRAVQIEASTAVEVLPR